MPEFSMRIRAEAPVEEVWKLLHDPSSFPRWWAGMETVEPGEEGGFTMWPVGYPDFPMPQRLEESGVDHRVAISCLISSLEFVWRLGADGEATEIEVFVRIPDAEAHRLVPQQEVVAASLVTLAELSVSQHREQL
ncbi:MAG: SRPBCC family protein [Friedmanniella sp.]|jgi:uncharacterized protein YndB with AHSA1/START domain